MHPGKEKCELLKSIRVKLAEANGIKYEPHECTNEEACLGTCPLCEHEVLWLEEQLQEKSSRGERVTYDVLSNEEFVLFFNVKNGIDVPEDHLLAGVPKPMGEIDEPEPEEYDNYLCAPAGTGRRPSDEEVLIESAGAYDIIKALQVLHRRGYEQLRIYPGMAPSGCSWRWMIYAKSELAGLPLCERKREGFPLSNQFPEGSTSVIRSDVDAELLADALTKEYPEQMERGMGADPEYVVWYEQIAEAADRSVFPIAYQDYDDPDRKGWLLGDEVIPYPPFENMGEVVVIASVAGLQFNHADDVWKEMERGGELKLKREPRNKYDSRAVAVYYGDTKMGYIPRRQNKEIAQLLDTEGPDALVSRVSYLDEYYDGSRSMELVVFRNLAYKMPEVNMASERMRVRFEDTEAEVISFSMEDTYDGLIEGTRACYSEHILKDLRPEPGLVVMPSFCGSDSCKELLPCHFVLHARTDFEHRLCVQWFGRYPSGQEPLCGLIEQVTLSIDFCRNCRFIDLDNL